MKLSAAKEKKGYIITRRIELYIEEEDKERRIEQRKRLRELSEEVFRAANMAANEQYFYRIAEQRIVDGDGQVRHIRSDMRKAGKKKKEADYQQLKGMLVEAQANAKQEFAKSPKGETYKIPAKGTSYDLLSQRFPNVPTAILNALSDGIDKTLKSDWKSIDRGERSLRTYRNGIPIPWSDSNEGDRRARLSEEGGENYLQWLDGIKFQLHYGRDRSNNRDIVKRVIAGDYGISNSSIQLKDKKIFLLLCVRLPEKKQERDPNIAIGVDLGINVPAYWAVTNGLERKAIGSREDFLNWRVRVDARRRQLQRSLKLTLGGKGRKKKLKALERFRKTERDYVHTYNHNISREVVNAALKHNAGMIKLELLEGYGRDEEGKAEKKFLLRNWSYYELQKMIEDKAKREGIEVRYVDPYHTSKQCSRCGKVGERPEQAKFICKNIDCKNYDTAVQADYNAALNIANSAKFVTSKEQCKYWEKHETEV